MTTQWVSFAEIKAAVSIEMVLMHYGLSLRRVNKTSLRGKCPLPVHGSDDSKASFGAQTVKNVWACQSRSCVSARGGRRGGNVLDFVAVMERCSIRDASLKLQEWFLSDGPKPAVTIPAKRHSDETESDDCNKPLAFTLKGVDASHPWLQARGISKELAENFGVGFFPGKGMMAGRVVIPIHNARGELVAYAGRAPNDTTEPRYLLPTGFVKVREVYNLHRAIATDQSRGVVVVEGFFGAMKLHEAGYTAVVALMGSSLSDTQAELIATNFKRAIVMLDGDAAGRDALPAIVTQLARFTDVRVAQVPHGVQPDALSLEQIREALAAI